MRIVQVMHDPVVTCGAEDSAAEAARLMWDNDIGVLPVIDDEGRAVAMITDRDLCMAAFTRGQRLDDIPVSAAMSRRLVACGPEDLLERAEKLMSLHQIRRLPVIDHQGGLLGIVTLNDLTQATRLQARRLPSTDAGLVRTFARIGRRA